MADYLKVSGAQVTETEREAIKQIAERMAERFEHLVVVNIGVMWGCTLWCLRAGAPEADLYGVDITPERWKIADEEELHAHIIKGDSRTLEFDLPIHLLLIDGDHHYEVISRDIANWIPRVVPGGVVIFHDYKPTEHNVKQFPELRDVKRAVDEWLVSEEVPWRLVAVVDSMRAYCKPKVETKEG